MDRFKDGQISEQEFSNWISHNCGYNISREDISILSAALDKNNDYRVTKDEFIASVSAPQDEDDAEEDEMEREEEPEDVMSPEDREALLQQQRQEAATQNKSGSGQKQKAK